MNGWQSLAPRGSPFAAVAAILLAGCSGSNSSAPPLASASIGATGGAVAVTDGTFAGTAVVVPAGALTSELQVAIYEDRAISERGSDIVGPAARFSPLGISLTQDAMLTLVFDVGSLPPGTMAGDIGVTSREGSGGKLTPLVPESVDLQAGRVTVATRAFAVFWVTAKTAFEMSRYLVLGDGNRYEYEGPDALDVSSHDDEPSFGGQLVWRYAFALPFFARSGVYLGENGATGSFDFLGQFDAPLGQPAMQEVVTFPFPLLSSVERVGVQRNEPYDYTGYEVNLWIPVQRYTGSGQVTVSVLEEVAVDTPAGSFDPCLLVEFAASYTDTRPSAGSRRLRLWFARDVGPVQLQREDGPLQRLLQAVVDGQVIGGR